MAKARAKIPNLILRVAVCVILLGWVFHQIFVGEGRLAWEREGRAWDSLSREAQWRIAWTRGPEELWQVLTQVQPDAALVSLVFMGVTILIGALRWRMVMRVQGLDLSFGRAAEISLVAHFFNSFLLGSTGGDLMKAYYAARETHHLKTEAVATVFIDRFLGLLSMLAFASLMMLPNVSLMISHRRLSVLASLTLAMLLGGLLVGAVAFLGGVSKTWPRARDWLRKLPKGEVIERSLEACRRFGRDRPRLVKATGLSMLLNFACVLQIWSLARGLGLRLDLIALCVIVPVVITISAVPVTPSGLGVRENLYVWLLAVPELGVEAKQALSLSLLAYAGSLFWSLLGGLLYVTFRQRHHLGELVGENPNLGD